MDITISVPSGHGQTAKIAVGPGGGDPVIEIDGGQQAPKVKVGQRERQARAQIEMEASQ
jgi:hypothetical protein